LKVILSRKGFDSGTGGSPSPLLIDQGRFVSFPIPEVNKIYKSDTARRYSDLQVSTEMSYLALMEQLGLKDFSNTFTHLDPDILHDELVDREPGWRGVFGQCDAAAMHLMNNHVEPGDLFLFFGWFRDAQVIDGQYRYISRTDRHIIWGYLQVGQIDLIDNEQEYEEWKLGHPHYRNRDRNNNTGYVSRECLSFAPELPGCGVFPFHSSLVLSNGNPNKRSEWSLPPFFAPASGTRMTYHENPERWQMDGDACILKSVSKGQEFVISGNPRVEEWTKGLFFQQSERSSAFVDENSRLIGYGSADGYKKRSKPLADRQRSVVRVAVPNNHPSTNDTMTVTMKCRRASSGEVFDVIFDIADLDKVRKYEWKVQKSHDSVYAVLQGTQNILLHRLICDDCLGKRVFARNGNYFDCRRSNLYAK
jgi:hypothetical protein